MIEVKNISLSFGGRPILNDLSFTAPADFILGIAGASGSGKSSLLKILSGNLDADSGTVFFNQKRVVGPSLRLIPGHPDIQLVNQDFALDLYHTVEENLRNKMVHLHRSQQKEFIEELLDLLQLTTVSQQKAILLSGGEQQRLSIGRALAKEPDVLILDEPFAHLDLNIKMRLLTFLKQMKQERLTTIILVSHDARDLLSLSDELIIIEQGQILGKGKPKELYYSFANLTLARSLGLINKLELDGETILFRPDEYTISDKINEGISVTFLQAHFMGEYYLNEFWTRQKESLFLSNKEPLSNVQSIKIEKIKN